MSVQPLDRPRLAPDRKINTDENSLIFEKAQELVAVVILTLALTVAAMALWIGVGSLFAILAAGVLLGIALTVAEPYVASHWRRWHL